MDRDTIFGWWTKRRHEVETIRLARLAALRDEALALFYQRYSAVGLAQVRWQLNDIQIRAGRAALQSVPPRPQLLFTPVTRHWLLEGEPTTDAAMATARVA